ncbi:kinase-like domain-containing protein [Rhizophagus irregularis DAOM 181602=DAOM 197198]|uniref:Cdc15p n=1 Tax=Rhizophagus irregularis (strain DAOM 197198w) TaxID=1432141 RepID=A0A015IZP7_RHIIW|nr:Cdc15p [Rhizophagus irregularis DAOM 197198w]GBC27932.2 kinase-like domain-containing protein [Rhizophagus irregularis DAOM 181602=DAOM 197198]
MDEIKLSNDVIEQIEDFDHYLLTEEQKLLIDKLITDKELKERYKKNGLCRNCKQPNIDYYYCRSSDSKPFKQNFKNWTSGNHVEYLAKGGFGTTFKAVWKDGPWKINYDNNQLERKGKTGVALKCLHNSQDITADFLKEVESNILEYDSCWIVRCFGITKDPKINNFMMVMELIDGSSRQHLYNNFISLNWSQKLYSLQCIAFGLKDIHNKGLIHHDFHSGNILSNFDEYAYITDLGLCQPANVKSSQNSNKKIYGVLPYVAPEVLRGKEYTQAIDIYGYGIIAYEICTGFPPYYNIAHDEFLAIKICHGLRPKCDYKIPQLIVDIINQCWDTDPLKRPNANELHESIWKLYEGISYNKVDSVICEQVKEADETNKKSSSSVQSPISSTSTLSYMTHPQAVYISRLLNFKNLPEPINADNEDLEYSGNFNSK